MSQRRRILRLLETAPVCGTELLDRHMPRYAARIKELRTDGHNIATRPCQNTLHRHTTAQVEYVLLPAGQLELLP